MTSTMRRSDDSSFNEDDYRDDIEVYMHYMDVSAVAAQSQAHLTSDRINHLPLRT